MTKFHHQKKSHFQGRIHCFGASYSSSQVYDSKIVHLLSTQTTNFSSFLCLQWKKVMRFFFTYICPSIDKIDVNVTLYCHKCGDLNFWKILQLILLCKKHFFVVSYNIFMLVSKFVIRKVSNRFSWWSKGNNLLLLVPVHGLFLYVKYYDENP